MTRHVTSNTSSSTEPTEKVSYSKLNVYLDCPELFRQKYFVKQGGLGVNIEEPLIKGTLAHKCIEHYLRGVGKEEIPPLVLEEWLERECKIQAVNDPEKAQRGFGVDVVKLESYAVNCAKLLLRCSAGYTKSDKIRTKDGGVPVNPFKYPPSQFQKEYNEQELYTLKFDIDNQAARVNPFFKRMSLANITAQGLSYLYIFELPSCVQSVREVELDLSYKKVGFAENKYYWNGLLDTEYLTQEGAVIINDHKTEKTKRRGEDILYDLQLNSYAAVRYEQTNRIADYLSITHLLSGELLVAQTDTQVMLECMKYLEEIQSLIDRDIKELGLDKQWHRAYPTKYNSPCLQREWDTGALKKVCPHLQNCWSGYYECVKDEVIEFFGISPQTERTVDVEEIIPTDLSLGGLPEIDI